MRRILLLTLIFTLVIFTAACDKPIEIEDPVPDPIECETDQNLEDGVCVDIKVEEPVEEPVVCLETEIMIYGECESLLADDSIRKVASYAVVDSVEEFELTSSNIIIYEHPNYPGMKYVDVEEFLGALTDVLVDLNISKAEVLEIAHTISNPEDENDSMTFIVEVDSTQNTIYFNDFTFVDYLNDLDGEINSALGFEITDYVPGNTEKTIDLDDYGFDIMFDQEIYYMPLSVASLFFSGSYLNTYVTNDEIHVVSEFVTNLDLLEEITISGSDEIDVLEESKKFTTLFFDHFYGLKDYYNIDSFQFEFDFIGLYEVDSLKVFNERLTQYIFDLDDLHTTVIDFGMNSSDVNAEVLSVGNKTTNFYTELLTTCDLMAENVVLYEQWNYYVLQINGFYETTPDDVATVLTDLNPGKDIYLDLSCNSGGIVYASFDILQYMTNEPVDVRMANAQTGEIVTTTIYTDAIDALPNVFYVYTSSVTFSAANLLTHAIQDNGLALIFGSPTSGGAAAVQYAVLPNNMIITHSSNTLFVDEEGLPLEDQIQPDFLEMVGDVFDIEGEVRYEIGGEFDFDYTNDSAGFDFDITIATTKEELVIDSVDIELWDAETLELIDSTEYTVSSFHHMQLIPDTHKLVIVRMIVNYQMNGHEYRYTYFSYTFDELPEKIDASAPTIDFGEVYSTTQHHSGDKDFFKVTLNEATSFRVLINNSYTDDRVDVYDELGERLYRGNTFSLPAGTYYFEVDRLYLNEFVRYTIELVEIYDDYSEPIPVALVEGDTNVTLNYDYDGDRESILFTITEEAIISINWDSYVSSSYFIGDETGTKLHSGSDYLGASEQTFMLPAGTYYLGFHNEMYGSVTATFTVEYYDYEISGSFAQPDPMFGTLHIGENTITFEERWDVDIYVLYLTEEKDIEIVMTGFKMNEIDSDGNVVSWNDQKIKTFTPGTYYFRFQDIFGEYPQNELVTLYERTDLSNEQNMIPIVFGEQFDVIIEYDGDQDFYTFTIETLQMIQLDRLEAHSIEYQIRNLDGDILYMGHYNGSDLYQLPPGDYVLVIGEFTSNYSDVDTYKITLSLVEVVDPEPSLLHQDISLYTIFTFPSDTPPVYQGALEYEGDNDFFVMEISTAGNYTISFSGDVRASIVTWTGEYDFWRDNETIYLEEGNYYILIYNSSGYTVDSYMFMILQED